MVRTPVRQRRRPTGLPSLLDGFTTGERSTAFDLWVVRFETYPIEPRSMDQLASFLQRVAHEGALRRERVHGDRWKLRLTEDRWLLGFEVTFGRSTDPARDGPFVGTDPTITLNTNRFLAHVAEDWDRRGDLPLAELLIRRLHVRTRLQAESLDGRDNYVPDGRVGRWRNADCAAISAEYLQLAIAFLTEQLDREYDDMRDLRIIPTWRNWHMRRVEACWEFEEPDAAAASSLLSAEMQRVASEATRSQYSTRSENAYGGTLPPATASWPGLSTPRPIGGCAWKSGTTLLCARPWGGVLAATISRPITWTTWKGFFATSARTRARGRTRC